MKRHTFWTALSRSLAALTVTLLVTFLLMPTAWAAGKYKVIHRFAGGADGKSPQEGLIFDSAGNLYGTTMYGGTSGLGTAFQLTPNAEGGWTEKVIHNFTASDGHYPEAALIFDQSGNLYGSTRWGGFYEYGAVFKLTPNADGSWSESVIFSPNDPTEYDGARLNASLTLDAAGNLYGTTMYGGGGPPYSGGTVFQLRSTADGGWSPSKLYAFQGNPDGRLPIHTGVVFDTSGNLYGATAYGGIAYPTDAGTVYKLAPNADGTWTETVLYRFKEGNDGNNPVGNLIFGKDGDLYGVTYRGGGYGCNDPTYYDGTGCGIIFQMTAQPDGSWKKTTIHKFTGKDGGNPSGNVIFDAAGNLYGTTNHAGDMSCGLEVPPLGCGTVFKLAPTSNGWRLKVLHTFHNRPSSHPMGGLVQDTAGNLYGTSSGDDTTTFGSVYEITP